ncbi:MAG: ComEC/Rec2 family competence protein [Deltaproteobacteria bacterium]
MKRLGFLAAGVACAALSFSSVSHGAEGGLRIYSIDVEGGQATLIVTPAGQSLLVDTGWPDFKGRDADRIIAATRQAEVKQIDFLIITHYHMDHVGGVTDLAGRIPIKTFVDHGPEVETGEEAKKFYEAYREAAKKGKRLTVKPGDSIPLRGVSVRILASNGRHLQRALPGGGEPNPACAEVKPLGEDKSENARSVGFLLTYGKFHFLDLGDLTWDKELALMCPRNPIGRVDVFLVSHHGMNISNSPALVWAIKPRVAIMNNGERKGGSPEAWDVIEKSPVIEDLWQLHYSLAGGPEHNVEEQFIANPEGPDNAYSIDVAARADGSFSVTNTRTGLTRQYAAK